MSRNIHTDFMSHLQRKDDKLVALYMDIRDFVLELAPEANELLYNTHALTSVYTLSEKMGDAFCHIPIYAAHLNLGFNRGTQLEDPGGLLSGTGKLIRHLPIKSTQDYRNQQVKTLLGSAIAHARSDLSRRDLPKGLTISKIRA